MQVFFDFLPSWFSVGAIGVDVFFLISGYAIMSMIDKYSIKGISKGILFIVNRMIRVWVPYAIVTIIFSYILVQHSYAVSGEEVIRSTFFLQLNSNGYLNVNFLPILPVGWSLNYEFLFYCSVFFSILFIRESRKAILFGSAPIYLVISQFELFVLPSFIWIELYFGVLLYIYRHKIFPNGIRGINIVYSCIASVICLIVIILYRDIAGDFLSLKRILVWGGPLFILIIIFYRNLSVFPSIKVNYAFSMYLLHWPIFYLLEDILTSGWISLFISLVVVFLLSLLFWKVVEYPLHRVSSKLIRRAL